MKAGAAPAHAGGKDERRQRPDRNCFRTRLVHKPRMVETETKKNPESQQLPVSKVSQMELMEEHVGKLIQVSSSWTDASGSSAGVISLFIGICGGKNKQVKH